MEYYLAVKRLLETACHSFRVLVLRIYFFQRFQSKTGNGIFLKWNGFITGHIRLQLITDKDIVILLLLINSKPFLALGLTVGRASSPHPHGPSLL